MTEIDEKNCRNRTEKAKIELNQKLIKKAILIRNPKKPVDNGESKQNRSENGENIKHN